MEPLLIVAAVPYIAAAFQTARHLAGHWAEAADDYNDTAWQFGWSMLLSLAALPLMIAVVFCLDRNDSSLLIEPRKKRLAEKDREQKRRIRELERELELSA